MPRFVSIELEKRKENYKPYQLHATYHYLGQYFIINGFAIPMKLPFVKYNILLFDPSEHDQVEACRENGLIEVKSNGSKGEEILPHVHDENGRVIRMKKHGLILKLS